MNSVGRRLWVPIVAVAIMMVWATPAYAVAGVLDTSFGGGDGKYIANITSGYDGASAVVVQPDGKIVVAGWAGGVGGQFAITRHKTSGALDSTFSGDGKQITNFTNGDDYALDVALQPDGKIVAVGWAAGLGGQFALARYNASGSPDTTFSGDGKLTTNLTSGDDGAAAVAIQPDGKIVVAGWAGALGGQFGYARYNPNGSLDTTFSGDGKQVTNITSGDDAALDLALQPDGKIVAAGWSPGGGGQIALTRLNPNGSHDATFSGNGKQATNITKGDDGASGVVVQPDGKIVVAGWAGGLGGQMAYARYSANGTLDPTFSGDGKQVTNFTTGYDHATDLVLQADGKIVAVGSALIGFDSFGNERRQFALTRLNTNGSHDATFSGDGKQVTRFGTDWELATGVALEPSGKIIAVGFVDGAGGQFGLARYLAA